MELNLGPLPWKRGVLTTGPRGEVPRSIIKKVSTPQLEKEIFLVLQWESIVSLNFLFTRIYIPLGMISQRSKCLAPLRLESHQP